MRLLECFAITAAILAIPLTSYGWTRTYGGEKEDDWGRCVRPTADGGYVITGYSKYYDWEQEEHFNYMYLVKTDEYGDTTWTRLYGGSEYKRRYGYCNQEVNNGGYMIVGSALSSLTDDYDLWLVRTDIQGDTLWTRTYGGEGVNSGSCIQRADDEGFIITGNTKDDVWLLRIDGYGDTLWTRTYGSDTLEESVYCVQQTSDEGYVMVGDTRMPNTAHYDLLLIKTDEHGDTLWIRTYRKREGEGGESGRSVAQTTDGGYIITGVGPYDEQPGISVGNLWLVKTDDKGDTMWTRTYGGSNGDHGACVQQVSDGGYIITGTTQTFGLGCRFDVRLLKTDVHGDTIWTRRYGGTGVHDEGMWVTATSDGGYIITGYAYTGRGYDGYDVWLLKTNEYGDTVWYEGEPRGVLVPSPDTLVDTIIPTAWFKNSGTYPIQDFYCHCQIWPKGGDTIATLSPPYHCKYLISYPLEPGDSVLVKFAEWFSDDSSRYVARFYTSKDSEPIWQTREKTVEFQGVPNVGIIEHPIVLSPAWELVNTIGQQITLQYSNYPQGFHADIFDAAGRKVEELKSIDASGTITWGDAAPTGVYFIRISSGVQSAMRKVILLR